MTNPEAIDAIRTALDCGAVIARAPQQPDAGET